MNIFKILKNKNFYLSPANDLTTALELKLMNEKIGSLGFVDSFKSGKNIYKPEELKEYDYVLVLSSAYWEDICTNFTNKNKIILAHTKDKYMFFNDYLHILDEKIRVNNSYDVLFLAFNKSNVIDASIVIRELKKINLTSAIIDINYENALLGFSENNDIETVLLDLVKRLNFKALVCSIDWELSIARPLIKECERKNIKTIGLVDGIEDFEDTDYAYKRNPYQTVEYVLTMGKNDTKFLQNKINKVHIVGLPKMYEFWNEEIYFPNKKLVMINVNFTYDSFEEEREDWLNKVIKACKINKINYIISHHHADKGNMDNLPVSEKNVYDTIRSSSIIISRFSTVILESLTLGKPVVYFNPHKEKVKLYKEPLGSFSIAYNFEELVNSINFELKNCKNVRERANEFLNKQCNINEKIKPSKLAATIINQIIGNENG